MAFFLIQNKIRNNLYRTYSLMRSLTMTSKKLVRLSNSLSPNGFINQSQISFPQYSLPFLVKHFIDIDRLLNSSLLRTRLVGVFFKEQFSVGFGIVVYYRLFVCCVYIVNPFYLYCNIKLKYFLFSFLIMFMLIYTRVKKWQPTCWCQAKMLYRPQYKNY